MCVCMLSCYCGIQHFATQLDCSPQGSSVHGIFQARLLEQVATSYSRGASQPREWTRISCVSYIGRWLLCCWASWEVKQHQWRSNCLIGFLWCDVVDHTLKVTQGRCVTDLITTVGDCGWDQQGALWGSTRNALPYCPFLKVGLLRHTSTDSHPSLREDYPEGVNFPCPLLWLQEHCQENEPSEKALRQKNSMSYDRCLRVPILVTAGVRGAQGTPHHPLVSPNRTWLLYSQTQFILFFLSFLTVGVLYEMSKRNTLVSSQRRKGLEKSLGI